jgi:hypothetical protein
LTLFAEVLDPAVRMSEPLTDLLARFKEAQPLLEERERLCSEALALIRDAAAGISLPHLASRLSLVRARVARLNEQIHDLLPIDGESEN